MSVKPDAVELGLNIGIDGRYLQDHFPGIGRYTYHLIKELRHIDGNDTFMVFYNPEATNSRFDLKSLEGPNVALQPVQSTPFSFKSQLEMPRELRRARVDLFHSPHYPLPLLSRCPLVCTIHDTIPLRDPAFMPSPGARAAYRLALFLALARSKYVIADSAASREDLMRCLRVPPHRLRVVYLGVEPAEPRLAAPDSERCILYVGTNKPHKNLPRLIRAYGKAGVSLPLVIAGPQDPRFPEAFQEVQSLGLEGRVRILGHVGEDDLQKLYRSADLFVFPSLAEGFGLPALEAMSHGVPVIASNHPALPEVVGEAALLVDPLDEDLMASAMLRVLEDKDFAQELSRRGRERALLFTWRKTAEGCLQLYREMGSLR